MDDQTTKPAKNQTTEPAKNQMNDQTTKPENVSSNSQAPIPDGYGVPDEEVELEHIRLRHLAKVRDPKTFSLISQLGLPPHSQCMVAGAGAGTVSAWLAENICHEGEVWSCDNDLRFHDPMPYNVLTLQHDHATDDLPADSFSLIHARAVLQHIPERDIVLEKFVSALKPGGWLVVEEGHFEAFASQPLPEPYATMHKAVCLGATTPWRDPNLGSKLLSQFGELGLQDLDISGDVWAMRPGESSGEWWFLALERAAPALIAAQIMDEQQCREAIAQARRPGSVMMSTLSLATLGRKPAES